MGGGSRPATATTPPALLNMSAHPGLSGGGLPDGPAPDTFIELLLEDLVPLEDPFAEIKAKWAQEHQQVGTGVLN